MKANKRDELVQNALKVFYKNGFRATGMDKLAAETGISKTSIYKHFRTKEDLILAVLRLRDETFRNWLFRRMEELSDTPQSQLLALFEALGERFGQDPDYRGCIFIKASAEYQDPDDPIHMQAAAHKNLVRMHVLELAKKAGLNDAETLARQLLILSEGAIVAASFGAFENPASDARQAAQLLITSAMPAP